MTGAPQLVVRNATSITLTINPGANPPTTHYAIRETTSGRYAQPDGTLDTTPTWQTRTQWGAAARLTPDTSHTFTVVVDVDGIPTNSPTSTAVTPPTVPDGVTVVDRSATTVTIAFDAPANPPTTTYALVQSANTLSYVNANEALGTAPTWRTRAQWNAGVITVTGLQPNTAYTFAAMSSAGSGGSLAVVTYAAVPPAPIVTGADTHTVSIVVQVADNPDTTEYAIEETTSELYVQADGTLGTACQWDTYTGWGGTTGHPITGLETDHTYAFAVQSRNTDGIPTDPGDTTEIRLTAPPTPVTRPDPTPTTTQPTVTSPAAPRDTQRRTAHGTLARTGTNAARTTELGFTLLALGLALTITTRRRRRLCRPGGVTR